MTAAATEARVAGFIAQYTPAIQEQLHEARSRLRALFPRGHELVFDNYNALVFGISPTDRTSDAFLSIAGYPRWITLFFLRGVDLYDPAGLLVGGGKQVRSIRLESGADVDLPAARALIAQAVVPYAAALDAAPPLTTTIKTEVAVRRPRRPPG